MFLKYNIWAIIWLIIILILSSTPGSNLPPSPFLDFDKFAHAGIYALLQILLLRGFYFQTRFRLLKNGYLWISAIIAVTYGGLMELVQDEIATGRSFDIYDMLANTVGVIVATLLWLILRPRK